jgi:hypothetical protein
MSIYPFFEWCYNSGLGTYVRDSSFAVPLVEVVHLIGLAMLLGSLVVMDLGLIGIGMRRQPVAEYARSLEPWVWRGLTLMVLSGVPIFMNEATRCYDSWPFRIKMTLLATAIIFHFTVHRKVTAPDRKNVSPWLGKLTGLVSMTLWFGVGMAGRAIGFV